MNKGQHFWHELWACGGQTAFHQQEVNADLIAFWRDLKVPSKSNVLVPLCGKSLDMLWLIEQGFNVIGIELSELAIQQFITENNVQMDRKEQNGWVCYHNDTLSLWIADLFNFDANLIPKISAIYDRASLIALPESLRKNYAQICLNSLKPEGQILLKTIDCETGLLQGPPYPVADSEVLRLYQSCEHTILSKKRRQATENDVFSPSDKNKIDTVWKIAKK